MVILIDDVEQIETILNHPDCLDKGDSYRFISKFLGRGLVTLGGAEWKYHRKLLNPSFHYNIVNSFEGIFNAHLKKLTANLDQMVDGVEEFDILEPIKECSLDMICGEFLFYLYARVTAINFSIRF